MSVIEVPKQEPPAESRVEAYRRGRSARVWHWTAGTGIALVALATMHIVAQHFIVHQKGGLRTYGEVLSYIANPVIFVLESAFLCRGHDSRDARRAGRARRPRPQPSDPAARRPGAVGARDADRRLRHGAADHARGPELSPHRDARCVVPLRGCLGPVDGGRFGDRGARGRVLDRG